jgi:hypothetical protein
MKVVREKMSSCIIEIQSNGLYKMKISEPYLIFFSKERVINDLTKEDIKKYKIPWCKIGRGHGVDNDIQPDRIVG